MKVHVSFIVFEAKNGKFFVRAQTMLGATLDTEVENPVAGLAFIAMTIQGAGEAHDEIQNQKQAEKQ